MNKYTGKIIKGNRTSPLDDMAAEIGKLQAINAELLEALGELVAMDNCNYDRAIQQKGYDKAQAVIKKARGDNV